MYVSVNAILVVVGLVGLGLVPLLDCTCSWIEIERERKKLNHNPVHAAIVRQYVDMIQDEMVLQDIRDLAAREVERQISKRR